MKSTQKNEMYMASARNLHLGPNATYIPLTRVGGFAFGNAKVLSYALGDAKVPSANGFVSQWNIGSRIMMSRTADYAECRHGWGILLQLPHRWF